MNIFLLSNLIPRQPFSLPNNVNTKWNSDKNLLGFVSISRQRKGNNLDVYFRYYKRSGKIPPQLQGWDLPEYIIEYSEYGMNDCS